MTFEQQLLSALTTELQSFKDICLALGFQTPTPDMRSSMKSLIARNRVEQVGQKRGARYRLRAETVATEEGASTEGSAEAVSEAPKKAVNPLRMALVPKGGKLIEDVWVDPTQERIVIWEMGPLTDLHRWILSRWESLAKEPIGILDLSASLCAQEDAPETSMVRVSRALSECVQNGAIRVRRQKREHDTLPHHVYCSQWPENNLVERR